MQKKIIALAVAAVASGAAFAQSNVTIYGIADAALVQTRASGNQTATQVSSGGLSTSRIGFKGVEDLGNGLKALFVLEYRLDIDQNLGIGGTAAGNASGPARQQLVGLTGGFGTVAAGRLQTTAYDWQGKYQVLSATAFDVHNQLAKNNFRINLLNDSRANNAVAYISPSFGGFSFAVNHSEAVEQAPGVADGAATDGRLGATLLGGYYDNGPLSVGLVYEKLNGSGQNGSLDLTERTDYALGASYDFGVVKVSGAYQATKNNKFVAAVGAEDKRDSVWQLGVIVPVTAKGKVHALYSGNKIASTTAADNGKGFAVAYTHDLSKRTTVYGGYGWLDNSGDGQSFGFGTGAGANGVGTAGGKSQVLAAGLRHSF